MIAPAKAKDALPSANSKKDALAKYQPQAKAIQETSAAAVLATCMDKDYGEDFGSCAFKAYHDNVLEAAGQPSDPIEVMLVEQLLWAHHRIGDLHTQAASAKTTEAARLFNAAAVRLMGEFRKTSLALREYRTPVVPKQVTVVKQQNLAAGDQQVAYLDRPAAGRLATDKSCDSKLGSKQEAIEHEPQNPLFPEPQTGGSWAAEPVLAGSVDAARPRAVAAGGPGESAVGAIHRPEDGGG